MTLADELERLGKKASPGPWENDSQTSLDDMGTYSSYAIYNGAGKVIAETSNSEAQCIHDDRGEGPDGPEGSRWDETARCDTGLIVTLVNNLPAIIAALRAQEWQPIETAPRDGMKVLLWPGYLMGGDPMTGWWARLARKWVAAGEPFDSQPTHWRPLPTPPAHDKGEPKP